MTECYLGLLYTMEDVAVYGYITPLKVKIILALALSDAVVRDLEITTVRSPIQPMHTGKLDVWTADIQGPPHGLLLRYIQPISQVDRRYKRPIALPGP